MISITRAIENLGVRAAEFLNEKTSEEQNPSMLINTIVMVLFCCFMGYGQTVSITKENQKNKSNNKMKIEIWSDVVCPFCYIGKRELEGALQEFKESDNIEIVWKSFELLPDNMSVDKSKTVYDYVAEKYNISIEKSKAMHNQLAERAKELGLDYNFDKAVLAKTSKAHQLIHFAKNYGKADAAEEYLFQSYFTKGDDLDDLNTLLKIGESLGLDDVALKKALEDNIYENAVKADVQEGRQLGVQGVPFFVFNRTYAVSGAQEKASFLKTLQTSFKEWQETQSKNRLKVIEGKACKTDEQCD